MRNHHDTNTTNPCNTVPPVSIETATCSCRWTRSHCKTNTHQQDDHITHCIAEVHRRDGTIRCWWFAQRTLRGLNHVQRTWFACERIFKETCDRDANRGQPVSDQHTECYITVLAGGWEGVKEDQQRKFHVDFNSPLKIVNPACLSVVHVEQIAILLLVHRCDQAVLQLKMHTL